ncbi:MAG TPA: phosphatase PAP2 family protein [Candidatus Caenarcaniphilales bacterium]|nr:phosphatase PAP2 family protein [Candidatus Caenarcaniphilales bacterium]
MNAAATPVPTERRGLGLTALAALVPFVLLAVWARLEAPDAWELELLVAAAAPQGVGGDVVRAITFAGDLGVWAAITLALATVAVAIGRASAGLLIALSAASDSVAALVKSVVERSRPDGAVVEVLFGTESFAFPSGHVVRAASLAAVVAWLLAPPAWRLPAAVAAATVAGIVMGYSRVALGVHWPTDALGGLLLGIFWFAATAWTLAARTPSLRQTQRPG